MLISILHRVAGSGMAFAALPVMLWWLGALASGPAAYTRFADHAMSWYGIIVLVGISWAFFNHMCSGIRHFVLDMGAGYELDTNRNYSILSIFLAIVLTVAFWAALLLL